MVQEVDGKTPVEAVLGQHIYMTFNDAEAVITREKIDEEHDQYIVEWKNIEDAPVDSTTFESLLIGCPECKTNRSAKFKDGEYHCPCGYSNELNLATLLTP